MRYRKIISKSSIGRGKCDASSNEARFIFNVGEEEEDPDDTDDNTDDDDNEHNLNVNATRGTINRVVYEQQQRQQQQRKNTSGPMNGNEFYIKSTNDIDAIEFHCSGVNNNAINVNTTNCSSSPTSSQQQQQQQPPLTSKSNNSKNNRRISSRSNVHS